MLEPIENFFEHGNTIIFKKVLEEILMSWPAQKKKQLFYPRLKHKVMIARCWTLVPAIGVQTPLDIIYFK